jgi:cytochrome c
MWIKTALILCFGLLLISCGGGGASPSSPTSSEVSTPIVSASTPTPTPTPTPTLELTPVMPISTGTASLIFETKDIRNPVVGAACPSNANEQIVAWKVGNNVCGPFALPQTSSGTTITRTSPFGSHIGYASMLCRNGVWEPVGDAACVEVTLSADEFCDKNEMLSWRVNDRVCSVKALFDTSVGSIRLVSTSPDPLANIGNALFFCSVGRKWQQTGVLGSSYKATCTSPAAPTQITDPLELATSKNCMACHAVAVDVNSIIGSFPSFKKISSYYKGNPYASDTLRQKIKQGSTPGNLIFGTLPMSANPQVTDADLDILVPWILNQP